MLDIYIHRAVNQNVSLFVETSDCTQNGSFKNQNFNIPHAKRKHKRHLT